MNEFESVKLWLRNTYNVGVSDEWLMACLEWTQQEHQGVLPSVSDLLPQVFQQWLLSDLTEIGEQVLPQNIVGEEKSELAGNYPLQLLSLVDVGFPLYGQKQKLQGRVNPNDEVSADTPFQPAWEPKPSRMLLLQLTDGHTSIQALEYKQIKDLHAELPSGFKVLVHGRALCRRGVIMLTPDCVQVLGGEVDTLVEQNTPVAVLEREMMRNREDEGKHAKTVFSGQFLSRGSDKMPDNSQKYFKKDDGYSGLTGFQRLSTPSLQHMKLEPRGLAASSLSQFGLKQEADPGMQYLGPEFKQEDDMNYDDCFSDDLDLQEIEALDCTTAACMETDTRETQHSSTGFHRSDPAHSWPGSCEREQPQSTLQNAAGTRTTSDMRLSTSLNQSLASSLSSNPSHPMNVSDTQNDVDVFDDDFEIDDISDSLDLSNNNNTYGLSLPGGKETNTFNSYAESQIMQNPIAGSHMKSSQPPLQQAVNKAVPLKPHVSSFSVPSKGQQNDPGRNNKLFKVKTGSLERTENLDTSKFPAKKQVKLSDMFSSSSDRNKSKLMSLSNDCAINGSDKVTESQLVFDDDDCCIVDDGCTAQKFSRKTDAKLSSNSASNLLNTSSVVAVKSSSSRSVMVSDSNTVTNNTLAEQPHPKLEQECGIQNASCTLAKAVIYPSSSLTGLPDAADRSPFQYLSDLTHMELPASLTVKAYISTLIEKLGTNGGANWSLACRINDGTACLDVDLADNVLVELVGFSAKDSLIMRQKMRSEPRVKDVLMEGLTKCQQKLINMSCLMEVDIVSAVRKPVVKKLIPLSRQHVLELVKRVEKYLSLSSLFTEDVLTYSDKQ